MGIKLYWFGPFYQSTCKTFCVNPIYSGRRGGAEYARRFLKDPGIQNPGGNRVKCLLTPFIRESVTKEETLNGWFDSKQEENEAQRENIARMCGKIDPDVRKMMIKSQKKLIISKNNKIGYCPVAKVATTTWAHFFLRTGQFSGCGGL